MGRTRFGTRAALAAALAAGVLTLGTAPAAEENIVLTTAYTYLPGSVTIAAGESLTYVNPDIATHTITSKDRDAEGDPLFDSGEVGIGASADVEGVSELAPDPGGYAFFCWRHPGMTGTLVVAP